MVDRGGAARAQDWEADVSALKNEIDEMVRESHSLTEAKKTAVATGAGQTKFPQG
jgi:hypothetical protein